MKKRKKMTRKQPVFAFLRPDGCSTPNEVGDKLGVTGEAVKQWIHTGRLAAGKSKNGYWWIREEDLKKFLANRNAGVEFKIHGKEIKNNEKAEKVGASK